LFTSQSYEILLRSATTFGALLTSISDTLSVCPGLALD
jgi:hypothetical protein